MTRKRRRFETEFKQQAVELSRSPKVSVRAVAEDLGISPNMLSRWRRELLDDDDETQSKPARGGVRRQMEEKDAEIAQLKDEIDFLKKATAYFVRTNGQFTR